MLYPYMFDVTCFSHALDLTGSNFNALTLLEFTNLWVSLFLTVPRLTFTRWWSKWEVMYMYQMRENFGDLEPFLVLNDHISLATWGKNLTRIYFCRLN